MKNFLLLLIIVKVFIFINGVIVPDQLWSQGLNPSILGGAYVISDNGRARREVTKEHSNPFAFVPDNIPNEAGKTERIDAYRYFLSRGWGR
uniref:Uncharacterized protein n=1 Tax=Acrobeloides nanus TaxID=290746 RepID=A0A914EL88_9BILA